MEKLIKKKQQIEHELEQCKNKLSEILDKEEDVRNKLNNGQKELSNELNSFGNLSKQMKNSKNTLARLNNEIKQYKENKLIEVRNYYLQRYQEHLKNISILDFRYCYSIFKSFECAGELLKKIEFKNLKGELVSFLNGKKNNLKSKLTESINSKLDDKRKTHELLFYIRFLMKYEFFFGESLIIEILYDNIYTEFEYHFMSNKETNRLDKPEWIFDYLSKKIKEYHKILSTYEKIHTTEALASNNNEYSRQLSFQELILRIKLLIDLKIREIENKETDQKRMLLINFGTYLIKFVRLINESYDILLVFDHFSEVLIKIQLAYFVEKIENIHEQRYTEWFGQYEDLVRESMIFIYQFRSVIVNFKLTPLINLIIEYNTVFIDSIRYIQREEIKALCYLYNSFDGFKDYLIDLENELALEFTSKKNEKGSSFVIDEQEMIEILDKITKFNLDNLKLIKNLLENDISNLLYTLKRFKFSPETITKNFMVELNRILEDYKQSKVYNSLKRLSGNLMNRFILEEILISHKFEIEEFLDFNFFFKKLKHFYDTEKWGSQEGIKCIKGLLEDKTGEGALYDIISKLYNNNVSF